jgi:acyl phosphate:glycerol-3-phosphate acyltransferase
VGRTGPRAGAVIAASFLAGSIPFSWIAARTLRGVDLREHGTGTVSGTGLWEVSGLTPLITMGVLEVAKGSVGPLLAGPRQRPELAALAAGAAVAGHNWSPFLRGAGGRGISPAIGALAVTAPPGTLVLLAGLAAGRLGGETAIGALAADAALFPVVRRFGGTHAGHAALAVLVPMLAKRLLGNHRAPSRQAYLWRLLLDRDTRDRRPH